RVVAVVIAATVVLVLAQLASGARGASVRVIATGLNNPRGVAVAPDGSVFVAQAGIGGRLKCQKGPEGEQCAGLTGSIDRVANGHRERWAAGFVSGGNRDGSFSVGMGDVAISPGGTVYGIETAFGPHPEQYGP